MEDIKDKKNAEPQAEDVKEETLENEAEKQQEEAPQSKKEAKKEKKLVDSLKEQVEALEKENESLKAAVAKEKEDYLRLMADFENVRKNAAQERLDLIKSAASDVIMGLLPVLDDCEQAMKMLENSADEAAKEGTAMIYNKLMAYLKSKGLERIESLGKPFDTDEHEALTQLPAPTEDMKGKVIEVFQQGYRLNGKIIRFAKVVVGA